MRRRFAVIVTCLLATSVCSSDLHTGYDPGSHGSSHDDGSADGYAASAPQTEQQLNTGNNEWTPMVGPGPSGSDKVIYHGNGDKTLVAGSPTSPVAESINYYGPPPPTPPIQAPYHKGHRYPVPVPVGYSPTANQVDVHQESHKIQAPYNQGYRYPAPVQQVPVGYGVTANQGNVHQESHKIQAPYHQGYRYPAPVQQVPVGYGVTANQVKVHHNIPTKTIINTIKVPVPQPYKVHVDKKVPYEVKVPVHVKVPRPVQVPAPRPVEVPVDKPYEVIVERKVPYEVRVPVEIPVKVPYHVDVPQPYPVPIVVPKPIIVKHPVPVVIKYIKSGESKGLFG